MNYFSKNGLVVVGVFVGIVLGLTIGYFAFHSTQVGPPASGGTGDYNSSAKTAQYAFSTASTTAFSALNSSGRDRIITDAVFESLGLSTTTGFGVSSSTLNSISLRCATSTNTGFPSNTNYVWSFAVSTSTSFVYSASTSPGSIANNAFNRVWKDGSNLVCRFQDNFGIPTTTPSSAKGFIGFNYQLDM